MLSHNVYAIDIEPEHDAIIEKPSVSKQASTPKPTLNKDEKNVEITRQNIPLTVRNSIEQPDKNNHEQRIYYARSVTSNNPEYKTRFSILHETPSPKRIAGERLYNLSDSPFRISVKDNQITILDNPVFNLTGINSASGRYGQIKILEGGVLTIHGTSNRFKGNWDVDGTGERNLKITPTNLVSGTIPVHIKTFKADGSVVTDETHDLTFKALGMGPYNGYWSDGSDIGIFLWGMSNLKMKSKEMTYIGLDLGIVTQNATEETGTVGNDPVENLLPQSVITPVEPLAVDNNTTSSIAPFGGNNFAPMPFIGGGFGGGFVNRPGNNTVIVVEKPVFCKENPNHPICKQDVCKENPLTPECQIDCKKYPNLPECTEFCKKNPNHPTCQSDTCKQNPLAPGCQDHCKINPTSSECCALNPSQCSPIDPCLKNPNLSQCNPNNPDNPVSEPLAPLAILLGLLGYYIRRKKNI